MSELSPYLPIEPKIIREAKVEVYHLSYYIKWDPQEVFYYAAEKAGFKSNTERTQGSYKYTSIDDKPIHLILYYFNKVWYRKSNYDASQEIRTNKIDREKVLLVRKYDQEFPDKYFHEILDYMDIISDQFWEVIEQK